MIARAMSGHDTGLRKIARQISLSKDPPTSDLTVFEGVVFWQVENVGILHAEQVIDLDERTRKIS